MKFTKKDFLNAKNGIIEIDEWIAVEENDLLHHTQVKSIPEVHVTGTLQFDHRSLVFSDLDLDGVMIRHSVDEKFAKYIKPVQKQFKNKFMGIYCNPSRHEAMIASEAEPDFVAFDVNEENAAEALEVMSWYAELFLIQSAVTYFEKIDKKLLDFADFVILNASDYKILVDKIKRLD